MGDVADSMAYISMGSVGIIKLSVERTHVFGLPDLKWLNKIYFSCSCIGVALFKKYFSFFKTLYLTLSSSSSVLSHTPSLMLRI